MTWPGESIRVVLADDETLIRAGCLALLRADPRIDVIAEAGDGYEAIDVVRHRRPDVVILDIRMPRLDGLAAAAQIRRELPGMRVLILTTFGEADYVAAALDLGVDGFVVKAGQPGELAAAVHAVMSGGAYLSPPVARGLIERDARRREPAADATRRVAELTDREREVLRLLADGASNAEIGVAMHLVEGTIKGYVSGMLRTLGVRNRVEAALLAYRAGLTR